MNLNDAVDRLHAVLTAYESAVESAFTDDTDTGRALRRLALASMAVVELHDAR